MRVFMLHRKIPFPRVHDEMPDSVMGADSFSNDWDPRRDLAVMDGDALNVSVMSLGGEVLVTVIVSRRSSIWELKGLIEKSIPGRHMKAAWMTLMLGPQVLANAVSLHDAGVVDGAMLCIIYAAIYKLFVCTTTEGLELWNEEGKREGMFLDPSWDNIGGAEFSPDGTFVLTIHERFALLWRVDTLERCPFNFNHIGDLVSAAFSPTGTTVLSACQRNHVKLWSVSSGQCVNRLEIGDTGDLITAFTADGGVALHTHDGRIALWNVETGDRVWQYHVDCISGTESKGFLHAAIGSLQSTVAARVTCPCPGCLVCLWMLPLSAIGERSQKD